MFTTSFRIFGSINGHNVIAMYNNFIYLWIHFWLPEIQLIANLLTNKVLIIFRNSTYCKSSTHLSHELHLGNFFFCLIDLWDLHDQGQENNVTLEGVLLPGTNMLLRVHIKHFDTHIDEVNICLPIMLTLSLGFSTMEQNGIF